MSQHQHIGNLDSLRLEHAPGGDVRTTAEGTHLPRQVHSGQH